MLFSKLFLKYFSALAAVVSSHEISNAHRQEPVFSVGTMKGRETSLPIPRFVSLKTDRARMRIGPAFEYAVKWLYHARGLPLEITEEYGNWRQVRDCDGVSGWMHQSLLSSDRTAVVGPWLANMVSLREQPAANGFIKAKLEQRVRVRILSCSLSWCDVAVESDHLTGFVKKSALWGIYPKEVFN